MLRAGPAAIGFAALVLVALGMFISGHAQSSSLLENGDFEAWAAVDPDGWSLSGTGTSAAWPPGSGNAALLTGGSSLSQVVAAIAGRTYSAEVSMLLGSGEARGSLRMYFLDGSLQDVGTSLVDERVAGAAVQTLRVASIAPAGAAYVGIRLVATLDGPAGAVLFDDASLTEQADGEATATPTFTPTPEDPPTPTPTNTPPANGSSGSGQLPGVLPPSFPSSGDALPIAPPPPGEALANGGFDVGSDGEPAAWDKFGGVLLWSQNGGKSGSASATLVSLTESTKWMHQVVAAIPGQWYEASATVTVSAGEAETWISVLWYPSADGSGENMRNDESERTSSHNWAALSLGPVQAPAGARSVRFRLMVQAAFPAAVTFDEATFHVADPDADSVAIGPSVDVTPEVPRFDATPESAGIAPVRRGPMPTPKPPRTGSRAPSLRPCDICLSEVMSDPANEGRDAPFEWVEVHNTTAQPVDLGGWSIGDSKSLDTLAAPLLLDAGAYLVVAGRSAEFAGVATLVRVADGEIGDGLNNDGDTVRLLRSDGSTADALEYGPVSDLPPATAGRSLAFDIGSGLWRTAAASPGGPSLSAPVAAASVPPTTFSPEPRQSYLPWIVLGVCVAVGVFTAPFAAKRLHKGASRASMDAWRLNGFRRFFRTSATLPGAKPKP